jgi:hypothetical protein
MSPLEALLTIADPETLVLARNLIGRDRLAILIAKAALEDTTVKLSPAQAASVLEMPEGTAADTIHRTAFKKSSRD